MKGELFFFLVCFMVANTWSSIQFKLASASSGKTALWHFVAGNVIGFLGPVALTFALKHGKPNLIYAMCFGGAFALLQLVSWRLFEQQLTPFQWAGIGCVGVGIILLQLKG